MKKIVLLVSIFVLNNIYSQIYKGDNSPELNILKTGIECSDINDIHYLTKSLEKEHPEQNFLVSNFEILKSESKYSFDQIHKFISTSENLFEVQEFLDINFRLTGGTLGQQNTTEYIKDWYFYIGNFTEYDGVEIIQIKILVPTNLDSKWLDDLIDTWPKQPEHKI